MDSRPLEAAHVEVLPTLTLETEGLPVDLMTLCVVCASVTVLGVCVYCLTLLF